jgi:SAM-dependent methyltransferase
MTEFRYVGSELELFSAARTWKAYWSRRIRPYIAGDVLEVGAGLGANTPYMQGTGVRGWVALEPDPEMARELAAKLRDTDRHVEVICGTLNTLEPERRFDTIIYIDVLEHIEGDRDELHAAANRLNPGGRVIVLSPACQWLFSPFDAALGHFRRYSRSMLKQLGPANAQLEDVFYLDSAGLLLSAGNKLLLRQSMPTKGQIRFWDRIVVPVSRVLDRVLSGSVGKSIVGIWRVS